MRRYGQFCPVAKAAEVFCQRWTALILRNITWGAHRFSDIQRGVPMMLPGSSLKGALRTALLYHAMDKGSRESNARKLEQRFFRFRTVQQDPFRGAGAAHVRDHRRPAGHRVGPGRGGPGRNADDEPRERVEARRIGHQGGNEQRRDGHDHDVA